MNRVRTQGISIVIPCLNEAATLARAIAEARVALAAVTDRAEVIVADNGSEDESRELATRAGARVVEIAERGYGSALHAGILAARFPNVVFADADLSSYNFSDLPALVAPLARGEADLVLGSRLKGTIENGAMPFLNRYFGTPVLSFLIRLLHGVPTSDSNSGIRAIRRTCYEKLKLGSTGMEYASEMLVRAAQCGLRYAEIPAHYRKDARLTPGHLRRWRDGPRHVRVILEHFRLPS